MSFEFWPARADRPAARAESLSDLRHVIRGWHPRSVRLTQKTDANGDVSFLIAGEFYGNVVEAVS
jgi:hypothetical protein